jgi:hypothetical protein
MSADELEELEKLAMQLLVAARKLPPGTDRQSALEQISKYRLQISAWKNAPSLRANKS